MRQSTLEFIFDFISPASYLAFTQLPALCAETGATLLYQPVLLGGVFEATGNRPPLAVPAKGRYILEDFSRFARRYGVPLRFNPAFPYSTVAALRGALVVQQDQPERLDAYVGAVFEAIWAQGRNLSDPAELQTVLADAGFDAAGLLAAASGQAAKDALRQRTEQAVARGVFGVPSFFVGEQLFFGQDRLDFVREALLAPAQG